MSFLLYSHSSPLHRRFVSCELTADFVNHWKISHPGASVIERDLTAIDLKSINAEWIGAVYTPVAAHIPEQHRLLTFSDSIKKLQQAYEYVIGVFRQNFGVPSALKLWIDRIAHVGVTFSYVKDKLPGLFVRKQATFLVATSGICYTQMPMASFNFVEPYLLSRFGSLSISAVRFLTAGCTRALHYGQDCTTFLEPHLEAVQSQAQLSQRGQA